MPKVKFILLETVDLFIRDHVAVERAISLARQADIIASLSTEALRGTVRHLHPSEYIFFVYYFRDVFRSNQVFMHLDLILVKILWHNECVHY